MENKRKIPKKILSTILSFLVIFLCLPMVVSADIGPKPSVRLEFVGIEDQVYYITLLSQTSSTGPYSVSDGPMDEDNFLIGEHPQEDMDAWQAFRNYQDEDGFYFIECFSRCNEQNTYAWTYYPPSIFKVLLYFPKEGKFISSDITEKYAFDSYYQVLLSKDGTFLTIKENYDSSAEILSLIVRIVLTVAVEVALALLFGLRKKNIFLFILGVNLVTQIILNVLLNWANYARGGFAYLFHYVWMELLIVVIEVIAYRIYFPKMSTEKPIRKWIAPVYAIVANGISFVVGLWLSFHVPGIF